MPMYEYRCGECGHQLEALQKFSDPHLVDCPSCGAPRLERLMSHSSFALRGGGWYADGYGPNSKQTETKAESTSTTPETKSEPKADPKPAAKAETKTPSP